MPDQLKSSQARAIARWCAYALALLAPGSFFVLPVLWLVRAGTLRRSRRAAALAGTAGGRASGRTA